ncbi:hypothetical protein M409DRAFT_15643 [Zasmidium cellare ATCC 36951]|uniref:Carbohydrate-binding module family 19 domain-containing protein n=1 Tax=Zasmidium cellare ATCC 36951 TaxID=1080233 RepID=A0A6A6D4L2_ZASCE|nr:uncharacterized protein M409DRAFT_15643 [Zasmidium cellare ATCC 36951]KAF2173358.1 hypothetical protein M409DRAFT_15643 [Zasmidium cellare ATCC 36951]
MRFTPFVFAGLCAARAIVPRAAESQSKQVQAASTPTPAHSVTSVGQPAPSQTAVLVKGGPVIGNGTVPGGGVHPVAVNTTSTSQPQGAPVGAQNITAPAHGNWTQPHGSPVPPQNQPGQSPTQPQGQPAQPHGSPSRPQSGPSQSANTPAVPAGIPTSPNGAVPQPKGSPSQSPNGPAPPSNIPTSPNGAVPQHPSSQGSPTPANGGCPAPGSPQPSGSAGAPKAGQSCPVDGALVCNGADYFGLCNFGKIDFWSHVAAGTACRDGKIALA